MDFDDALEVVAQVRSTKRKVKVAKIGDQIPVPDVEGIRFAGKRVILHSTLEVVDED